MAERYRVRAHLLCHDVRLSAWIEEVTEAQGPPTLGQAERLLDEVARALVDAQGGEECPYQLSDLEITPLD